MNICVTQKEFVPYETKVAKMVGSTFSSCNVHEVVDANNNSYRNMIMDAMITNQSGANECSFFR